MRIPTSLRTALIVGSCVFMNSLSPATAQENSKPLNGPTKRTLDNLYKYGRSKAQVEQCLAFASQAAKDGDEVLSARACQAASNIVVRTGDAELFDDLIGAAQRRLDIRLGLVGTYPRLMEFPTSLLQREKLAQVIAQAAIDGKEEPYVTHLVDQTEKCAESETLRKNLLLRVLLESSNANALDRAASKVKHLITGEDLEVLRQRFHRSFQHGKLNHPVFLVLSYVGDEAILSELEDCKDSESTCGLNPVRVEWAIQQIKLQHPPEQLLEAMTDPSLQGPAADRVWMMERALAAGLPIEEVRSALIEYVGVRADPQSRSWTREREEIIKHGKRLNIISDALEAQIPKGPPVMMWRGHVD